MLVVSSIAQRFCDGSEVPDVDVAWLSLAGWTRCRRGSLLWRPLWRWTISRDSSWRECRRRRCSRLLLLQRQMLGVVQGPLPQI